MRTEQLGTVQLHATMQNNVLGATLATASTEAHHWLTAQLPALAQTLTARQVQVGNLQLVQSQTGGGSNGNTQNHSQPQAPPRTFMLPRAPATPAAASAPGAELLPPTPHGSRLNLLA